MGGVGNFVVDVFADGGARATLRQPAPDGWALTGGTLTVTRQRRGGARYQSSVAFAAGARPTEVLMRYLVESEQIVSLLDVSLGEGAQASAAVGYLVQLMPEGSRDDLARLVDNLATTGPLQVGMTTDDPDAIGWAGRLLAGVHWDQVARQEVAFRCPCSAERVLALLASLPRADLAELVEGLEAIETRCDYCGQSWTTPVEQIQPLLDPPS
jgi:molecular chaperone Hsp33